MRFGFEHVETEQPLSIVPGPESVEEPEVVEDSLLLQRIGDLCRLDGVAGAIHHALDARPQAYANLKQISDALHDFSEGFIRFGNEECNIAIDGLTFFFGKYDTGVLGVVLHSSAPASVRKSIRRTMRKSMRRGKGL